MQGLTAQVRAAARTMTPTFLVRTTQAAPAPAPEPKKVTVTGALDVPSLYVFRGIRQEFDPAVTLQPFVNVAVAAADGVTVNVGSWNSLHTGSNRDAEATFYESDIYGSVALSGHKVNPTILYTAYTNPGHPAGGSLWGPVHELAFIAAFDDSGSAHPLAPTATVAVELGDKSADGGKKGVYFEFAVTPAIPMADSPVTVTIPIKLGMSLKDYYEGPNGDSKFGYVSAGVALLGKLSDRVDLHGSVLVYGFGDTLKAFNNGEAAQVVGSIGLGFSF